MSSSVLLKVFEYCIADPLKKHLKINHIQFGFTENSSCANAITFLKETVFNYTSKKSNVHAVALDLSKAYDKININLLIDKLVSADLPLPLVKIIGFMLKNTHVNVRCNGYLGREFKVMNGARQGGIISSIIFNFYIDECINIVSNMDIGCVLKHEKANIVAYADDIIVMAPSSNALQIIVDVIGANLLKLCLKVNVDKSGYIVFKANRIYNNDVDMKLNGLDIKRVKEIKYLGVIINEDLSLKSDINRVTNDFLKQFNGFYHKFSFLHREIKYFLFKTYTSSFYGSNLWIEQHITENKIREISIAYHKAVKKLAGLLPWDSNHDACKIVGVNIFKHLLTKRMLKHYRELSRTENVMFRSLRYYLLHSSLTFVSLNTIFKNWYGVENFKCNDYSALYARIDFIERNEPRSYYNTNLSLS